VRSPLWIVVLVALLAYCAPAKAGPQRAPAMLAR
jgi:hypothetical protein